MFPDDDNLIDAAAALREYAKEIVQRSHTDAAIKKSERIEALAARIDPYAGLD